MLIELLFICFTIGTASYFTHWSMGSPSGGHLKTPGTVQGGRIFSRYGIMLIEMHDKHEYAEAERLDEIMKPRMRALENRAHFIEYREKTERLNAGTLAAEDMEAYNELTERVVMERHWLRERVEREKRVTFTKAAGACLVCFSFWFAVAAAAGCVVGGLLALNLWLISVPFLVAFFTQMSRIIYNT